MQQALDPNALRPQFPALSLSSERHPAIFFDNPGGTQVSEHVIKAVADYYRTQLSRGKWRLVSDVKSSDGSTVLYAEQNGPPLWVRIWKQGDQPGSMVQLSGAVVAKKIPAQKSDSSKRPTPQS